MITRAPFARAHDNPSMTGCETPAGRIGDVPRARDPQQPLPRDPGRSCRRGFLYPYEVVTVDGESLTLADATLAEFAEIYSWNAGESPRTLVVNAVQNQCWSEHQDAMRHQLRLLAIGTLGVAPHEVGEAIFWHRGYVAMHDGDPLPEPELDDYFAFWTGDDPDDLGGVCEYGGLLCWWEAKLGPGWVRETGYFLQELHAFAAEGPPERVQRIWIDRDVEAELRPLVTDVLQR